MSDLVPDEYCRSRSELERFVENMNAQVQDKNNSLKGETQRESRRTRVNGLEYTANLALVLDRSCGHGSNDDLGRIPRIQIEESS